MVQRAAGRAADSEPSDRLLIRDAGRIEGSNADRAAADFARARYRRAPMATLEPEGAIAPLLCPGERLLAVRRNVVLELGEPLAGSTLDTGSTVERRRAGDLYLTSRRLLVLSDPVLGLELEWIAEIGVAGDQLLLTLRDGFGLCLGVPASRLLRVEISAARASARRARSKEPGQARVESVASAQVAVPAGGLGPVADSQLVEKAADVTLHGPR